MSNQIPTVRRIKVFPFVFPYQSKFVSNERA